MDDLSGLTGCAPRPSNETQRLALLHSLALLDTPAETSFDAITKLAAQITGRPIALIGLVDAERTWFKSRVGLEAAQSPRDISFCGFAIAADDVFEVPDAHADPRFVANPLVTGPPHVRYYAGVPLRVGRLPMGTLCVVDHEPHRLDEAQLESLRQLGHLAVELLERRLASRAKTEFIGHMNHEMRTPLNAILGFGQLLEMEAAPGSRTELHVQHILQAGRHLLDLIVESLDLMRLEAGAIALDMQEIDLVPLLTEVAALVAPMADERHIQVQLNLPAQLRVRADVRRARQVLLNLAGNAIKYSRQHSAIALHAGRDQDGRPWTAVHDSGRGLTPVQIGQLFKPFERLGQDRGSVEGTGLGLSLSAHLVEAMGGRIDVSSEVGRGSVFSVRWQDAEPAALAPAAASAQTS
jgi:signal transduction histidine kinase